MRPTTLSIGTISHGTMRPEDLIPEFVYHLNTLHLSKNERLELNRIQRDMNHQKYFESEDSEMDLNETLWEMMNNHCPRMCYFASRESDGSDYGVWPIVDDEDQIRLNDPSELATCGDNTAYVVNDHGNVSYYVKHGSRWICEWSVV